MVGGLAGADHARVVQELKINLKDVATYFHANAQKTRSIADYQEAARWYHAYLKSFPDDADSAQTNYLLAEALFESHQYPEAASEYEHTAYGYPKNDKSATAAYAGLVAYQKGEEGLSGADRETMHKRATDAGVKFAQTFPEHPDSAGVLTRAAEEIFAQGDRARAVSVSESILARQPPVDTAKQRIAWTIIAQAHFEQSLALCRELGDRRGIPWAIMAFTSRITGASLAMSRRCSRSSSACGRARSTPPSGSSTRSTTSSGSSTWTPCPRSPSARSPPKSAPSA